MNINCVICSDLFIAADSIYTTPCGHIFHHHCLLQWLEKSKSCPQCRFKCNDKTIHRVYFNQISNIDSTECSASLQERVDDMQLSLREKDQAIKSLNKNRDRLMDDMKELKNEYKRTKVSDSQKNEVISIMNHQIDLLFGHKQKNEKLQEENQNLVMKVNLMQSVESILTSCQKDVDEILGQQLSVKDLSTMVGALKRELNNNELRKNELRRQLANVKNDLRAEQDVKKRLQDKVDYYESENHRLSNKCEKLTKTDSTNVIVIEDSLVGQTGTPDGIKKSKFAMRHLDGCQNTPSPLGTKEFNERVTKIQDSTSPYMKIKSSSIGLAGLMKKANEAGAVTTNVLKRTVVDQTQLSIFKKARLNTNSRFMAVGSSERVIQSGSMKAFDSTFTMAPSSTTTTKRIKRLAPLAQD